MGAEGPQDKPESINTQAGLIGSVTGLVGLAGYEVNCETAAYTLCCITIFHKIDDLS